LEERPRRFSLPEALFEGSRSGGREDCLSTPSVKEDANKAQAQIMDYENGCVCEFHSAEKNASGTA